MLGKYANKTISLLFGRSSPSSVFINLDLRHQPSKTSTTNLGTWLPWLTACVATTVRHWLQDGAANARFAVTLSPGQRSLHGKQDAEEGPYAEGTDPGPQQQQDEEHAMF